MSELLCTGKRRHQTLDRTTKSLHYFNSYAVADRVNFSTMSERKPDVAFDDDLVISLLPCDNDLQQLLRFEVHVSRILVKHLAPLKRLMLFLFSLATMTCSNFFATSKYT